MQTHHKSAPRKQFFPGLLLPGICVPNALRMANPSSLERDQVDKGDLTGRKKLVGPPLTITDRANRVLAFDDPDPAVTVILRPFRELFGAQLIGVALR